jgi:hypothetical protein
MLKFLDIILISLISLLALIVTIADFFGLADGEGILSKVLNPTFFDGLDTSKVTLILLSLLAIRVCILSYSRESEPDAHEKLLEKALRDYDGTYLTEFADGAELEAYLARRIGEAKVSVRDLSWKNTISGQITLPKRERSFKAYEDMMIKASLDIDYREIFVFSDVRRVDQCLRRLKAARPGYSCSYFSNPDNVPRLQFVIVDDKEVIFASSSYPKLCAIRGASVGAIFVQYFDEAWSKAMPLRKSGRTLGSAQLILEEARKLLGSQPIASDVRILLHSPSDVDSK